MEALGEEAGWKRKDEGGQAMESLGTGAREEVYLKFMHQRYMISRCLKMK